MHNMDWDDLRFVLAVSTEGSASGAARLLGVNHATVIRRIKNFEARWPHPLFEHRRDGYRLTEAGSIVFETAQSIEDMVKGLALKASGESQGLSGHVRVTTTDSLFPIIVRRIPRLREAYPDITLDLSMSNKPLDLFNRDADIALRPSNQPPPDLVGRRLGAIRFAIYCAKDRDHDGPLKAQAWLGPDNPLLASPTGHHIAEFISGFNVVARADSFVSLQKLAEAGIGHAILPTYLGDSSDQLVRAKPDALEYDMDLWILTHPDTVRAQRVRVCMDFLYHDLRKDFSAG